MPVDYGASFSDAIQAAAPKDLGGVLQAIISAVLALPGNLTPEMKMLIHAGALKAYDAACVAIDMPRVPDWIEERLEAAGRKGLSRILDSLLGV